MKMPFVSFMNVDFYPAPPYATFYITLRYALYARVIKNYNFTIVEKTHIYIYYNDRGQNTYSLVGGGVNYSHLRRLTLATKLQPKL